MSRFRILAPVLVIVFLIIGGVFAARSYLSLRPISLTNKTTQVLSVYKAKKTGSSLGTAHEVVLLSLQPAETRHLKFRDGSYVSVMSDSDNKYANKSINFSVTADTKSVSIDSDYSNAFLSSFLATERPLIMNVVNGKLASWPNTYNINTIKLYKHGEWAGVIFSAKDPLRFDDLRAILKKSGTTWELSVNPPQIVIGKPSHPDIPPDVISDIATAR